MLGEHVEQSCQVWCCNHLFHTESYIMMLFIKESPDLGMEDDACCHVGLGAGEGDAVAQLHPGRGQDGAGVRRRQPKHILLTIVQQLQHNCNIKQATYKFKGA